MERIIILDFGSQYTQLIARRLRELQVCSEVYPYNKIPELDDTVKAVVLSGSPYSVKNENALHFDIDAVIQAKPVLAVCYGAQYLANHYNGLVERSDKREYGRAQLMIDKSEELFDDLPAESTVWMSHGDTIKSISDDFEVIAKTSNIPIAAFKSKFGSFPNPVYAVQFHPEVTHSEYGSKILSNFIDQIAKCKRDWTPASYIQSTIQDIRNQVKDDQVILGLSGGVDSSVAASLLQRAIDKQLVCVFIDNGLLRLNEFEKVLDSYKGMGLNIIGVDASDEFLDALEGVTDPETKRKTIGRIFIEVFERESKKIEGAKWLAQGTIYPDVIESASVLGPAETIKSHHNVGGLPEKLDLKIIEPLRMLFKDEVRAVGRELEVPAEIVNRHPFPGPGLSIRMLGEIRRDRLQLLKEADNVYIELLKESGWYDKIWQAGAILLPVKSVGVMGDERTYEYTIALRAVSSLDGMTADWVQIPYDLLAKISNEIINQVKGINRVVYDISSKPPATIEWE